MPMPCMSRVLNAVGEVVVHKNIPTKPKVFLRLIKPYRERLVVGCECMFSWYSGWPIFVLLKQSSLSSVMALYAGHSWRSE